MNVAWLARGIRWRYPAPALKPAPSNTLPNHGKIPPLPASSGDRSADTTALDTIRLLDAEIFTLLFLLSLDLPRAGVLRV